MRTSTPARVGRMAARVGMMAALLALGSGCSNETDETANVFPWDRTGDSGTGADTGTGGATGDTAGTEPTEAGACADCPAVDQWYRFTKLELTHVAGQTREENNIIDSLNGIWKVDIAHAELNILLRVAGNEAGRLDLEAVSGARVGHDGAFCRIDASASSFGYARVGCALQTETPSSLGVYSGSTEYPKNCAVKLKPLNSIPVADVTVTADLGDGCVDISGEVRGILIEEEFNQVCSCLDIAAMSDPEAYKPSDEACSKPNPAYEGTSGQCVGCEQGFLHLASIVPILGGIPFEEDSRSGKKGASIAAQFAAVKIEAPEACP